MAATPHPYATCTAVDILRRGGNAMDAAVAAAAVLAVVEPGQTGIGGDCFALFSIRGGSEIIGFNGSGRAPAAATADWYASGEFDGIPPFSAHAVTIPGAVDAWHTLINDHGKMSFDEIFQPAINYAEEGYVVHARTAKDWLENTAGLSQNAEGSSVYLPDGKPPAVGTVHRMPKLAETLRAIALNGSDAFYGGAIAEEMVRTLHDLGGHHTLDDFANYRGEYVTPISSTYRGHEVVQIPPNAQGVIALLMLGILEGFDLGSLGPLSAERLHLEIEAGRLAYEFRNKKLSDPDFRDLGLDSLLSRNSISAMREKIDPGRAMLLPNELRRAKSDTVYLSVVDKDRNAISFINSIFYSFGSGITTPNSGILLHNRGVSFKTDPAHPNCIGPGKRPMHTVMPGFVLKNGRPIMPFGVMGGDYQPFGHVHFLTNLIDFGCDLQEALDMARVFHDGTSLQIESGIPPDVRELLAKMGHSAIIRPPEPLGGGQVVIIDWERGVLSGASDPRMDGCALGF
jgi:gamma-glutamyltranspeptidase/glutathione hydrolase